MGYPEVISEARSIMSSGDYDAAEKAECLLSEFAATCPDTADRGLALCAAGDVCYRQGKVSDAIEYFRKAELLLTEPCDRVSLFSTWAILAERTGRIDDGDRLIRDLSCELAKCRCESVAVVVYGYVAIARLRLQRGEVKRASAAASSAVETAERIGMARAEAYSVKSAVAEAKGEIEEAIASLEQAMIYMSQGHCLMNARAEYSRLLLIAGDEKTAKQYLMKAVEVPDLRDRVVIGNVLHVVSQFIKHDPEAAIAMTERLSAHLVNSAREEVTY